MFGKACLLFTPVRVERHIVGNTGDRKRLESKLALKDEIILAYQEPKGQVDQRTVMSISMVVVVEGM